jgi:hypothetical protein
MRHDYSSRSLARVISQALKLEHVDTAQPQPPQCSIGESSQELQIDDRFSIRRVASLMCEGPKVKSEVRALSPKALKRLPEQLPAPRLRADQKQACYA